MLFWIGLKEFKRSANDTTGIMLNILLIISIGPVGKG
jgi:hypothetical protein